jgi:hypothetical protein
MPPKSQPILAACLATLLLAGAGCAVQSGSDPVLEARERELRDTREIVAQLKKELEGFKLDYEAIVDTERKALTGQQGRELEALRAQLAERDRRIEELAKNASSGPVTARLDNALVTFTSGRTTTCQVLVYRDGKLTVKLPGGQTTQAGLSGILSIEWPGAAEASTPPGVPSSSVESNPPALPESPPAPVAEPPPAVASAPAAAPPALSARSISLAPPWKHPIPGNSLIAKELGSLLKREVRAQFDPAEPTREISLPEGLAYLMPVDAALEKLGARRSAKKPVTTPGFPRGSFFFTKSPVSSRTSISTSC